MSRRPRVFSVRPIPAVPVLLAPRFGVEGWVTLEHRRKGELLRSLHFPNLITNAGLDALGSLGINGAIQWLAAGTSGTAPDVTQTTLGNQIGARTDDDGGLADSYGWESDHVWVKRQRVFGEGSLLGEIAELGFFSAAVAGVMWNRVLVTDDNGDPTTVEMESDDELVVLYEVRLYPPMDDVAGTVTLGNITYDYTSRICNWEDGPLWTDDLLAGFGGAVHPPYANESDDLVAIDEEPPMQVAAGTAAALPYSAGSHRFRYRATWVREVANWGDGVGGLAVPLSLDPGCHFQVVFDPPIPKTDEHKLKVTYAATFGRR